jgi:hypothetical protein
MSEYHISPERFGEVVRMMRDLGVVQAFGIILGPAPRPAPSPEEEKRDRRQERIDEARAEVRIQLAATGHDYTDAQIDALLEPELFGP